MRFVLSFSRAPRRREPKSAAEDADDFEQPCPNESAPAFAALITQMLVLTHGNIDF